MDVICYPLLTRREMAVLISKNFLLIVIHSHTDETVIGSLELPYAINFKMGADYNIYIIYDVKTMGKTSIFFYQVYIFTQHKVTNISYTQ